MDFYVTYVEPEALKKVNQEKSYGFGPSGANGDIKIEGASNCEKLIKAWRLVGFRRKVYSQFLWVANTNYGSIEAYSPENPRKDAYKRPA